MLNHVPPWWHSSSSAVEEVTHVAPEQPGLAASTSMLFGTAQLMNCLSVDVRTISPSWLGTFTSASKRLLSLAHGWDGPGSMPLAETVLYKAERITRDALANRPAAIAPYLVPAGNGSVQIEWHEAAGEIELTVDPNGQLYFWGRDHLSGAEFEGQDEEARALFFDWAPRIASSSHHGIDDGAAPTPNFPRPTGTTIRPHAPVA